MKLPYFLFTFIFIISYSNTSFSQDLGYKGLPISIYFENLNAPKNASDAKMLAIKNAGGFSNKFNEILGKLPKNGILNYLYSDIDFIFIENSDYCPNAKFYKYKLFNDHKIICSRIEYQNFDNKSFALLIKSNFTIDQKNLLIYNAGHQGFVSESDESSMAFFKRVLDGGDDILMVSMPFTGLDYPNYPLKIKSYDDFVTFNPAEFSWPFWPHGVFEFYDTGTSSFMRFFVDNVVINAINLAPSYSKINYLGLSGGATTGLYACNLLRDMLKNCILSAGVMPIRFRLAKLTHGDYEQHAKEFHQRNGVIAVTKEISSSNTLLSLTYNSKDGCCFDGESATEFEKLIISSGLREKINFEIFDSDKHEFNSDYVSNLIFDSFIK